MTGGIFYSAIENGRPCLEFSIPVENLKRLARLQGSDYSVIQKAKLTQTFKDELLWFWCELVTMRKEIHCRTALEVKKHQRDMLLVCSGGTDWAKASCTALRSSALFVMAR